MARVAIVMGSGKDRPVMQKAAETLRSFEIESDVRVLSAHKTPDDATAFAEAAAETYSVIIAGAGKAAHLAGAVAAHSTLPVIGVPIAAGKLGGLDALLSTVQMPTGIPVATVAVDSAANAAYLAVAMLAATDDQLAERLDEYRESLRA